MVWNIDLPSRNLGARYELLLDHMVADSHVLPGLRIIQNPGSWMSAVRHPANAAVGNMGGAGGGGGRVFVERMGRFGETCNWQTLKGMTAWSIQHKPAVASACVHLVTMYPARMR